MGLDMYLYADKYISNYSFAQPNEKAQYKAVLGITDMAKFADEDTTSMTVRVVAMYWRKANAIHSWFVQNCQEGKDECQTSYVSKENLETLLQKVTEALDAYNDGDYKKAEEILTPKGGFFFGYTDIDEWYAEDLKRTKERLMKLLAMKEVQDGYITFAYHSSW